MKYEVILPDGGRRWAIFGYCNLFDIGLKLFSNMDRGRMSLKVFKAIVLL